MQASAFPARGWTLVELLIVLAVLGILASIAVPLWQAQLQRVRRADAVTALMQLQQAQERWRMRHPDYTASLGSDGLALSDVSRGGHYRLAASVDADQPAQRYELRATATGAQSSDADCRHLRLRVTGGTLTHDSGPDEQFGNDAATNRRCWSQ